MDRFPQRAEKKRGRLWAFGGFAFFLVAWSLWVVCSHRWAIPDLVEGYFSPGDVFWWLATLALLFLNRGRLHLSPGKMLAKAPSFKLLLPFFALTLLYGGAVMLVGSGGPHLRGQDIPYLMVMFSIVALQEELLFRGFFYNLLAASLPPVVANLLSALFFLLIHVPGWLLRGRAFVDFLTMGAGVFALGLAFGWLFGKSKSLWTPILAHLAWDVCARLI